MRSPLIEEDTVSEASSGQHASPFELELLLKRIGGTGLFQYFLIGFIGVLFGFSGMLQLSFLLTGRTPLLLCPNDSPSGGERTISGDGCTIAEACDQPLPARQYLTPNYTFTSYASEFDLICDQSYLNALLTSSIYLGLGAGAPFAGPWRTVLAGNLCYLLDCFCLQLRTLHQLWSLKTIGMLQQGHCILASSWLVSGLGRFCLQPCAIWSKNHD